MVSYLSKEKRFCNQCSKRQSYYTVVVVPYVRNNQLKTDTNILLLFLILSSMN